MVLMCQRHVITSYVILYCISVSAVHVTFRLSQIKSSYVHFITCSGEPKNFRISLL